MKLIDLNAGVKVTKDNYLSLCGDVISGGFSLKLSAQSFTLFSSTPFTSYWNLFLNLL